MKMNDTERGTTNRSSNGKGGEASVPASAKEIVLSLKEIVNYPDHEIYAMLKECNMDPNDAIQRLLSQDPFHEVKRRREKKKEIKEPLDYKPRGTSSRRGRTGVDHVIARAGATQYGSSKSGSTRSKLGQKTDGMNVGSSTSTFSTRMAANGDIQRFDSTSDFPAVESTRHTGDLYGGDSLYSQPISGYRSTNVGTPGELSMADIVRSGRPGSKPSSLPVLTIPTPQTMNANSLQSSNNGVKQSFVGTPIPSMSQHELLVSHNRSSKIQGTLKHEPDVAATQHVTSDDEQSPMNASSVSDPSGASVVYMDLNGLPNLHTESSLNSSCPVDELSATEKRVAVQPLSTETSGTALASHMHMVMENLAVQDDSSHFDDAHFNGYASHQAQELSFEESQGVRDGVAHSLRNYRLPASVEDVKASLSSNVAKLQQLQLLKEESEDNMAVKLPNHFQDPSVDCSHLSFGSFASGISAAFSAQASKDDREETSETIISSSLGECATRNSEYSESDQPQAAANENFVPRSSSFENFDSAPPQLEVVKYDNVETTQVQHYPYPSSVPNYALENAVQATVSAYLYEQTDSSPPNLSSLSTLMQSYGSSSQGSLLSSSAQPARESEFSLSSFRATRSMAMRYSSTVSNISGPSIATPEVAKPSVFSSQSSAQTVLGGNMQSTQALPVHVPLQAYSQPAALPLQHFGNMFSYSYLPQSFAYSPSTFQNSGYHSSSAAVHGAGTRSSLPQYKSSMPMNSLIPSAAVAAGYGGFGSSASFPGNFALNPSSSSGATPASYDDILSSQFKDSDHLLSIPQNETLGMWTHVAGSRSVSARSTNTYYTLQGQTQESILRQMQQQVSERATSGYTNFYHSQTGLE